jgi:hypothetical protein
LVNADRLKRKLPSSLFVGYLALMKGLERPLYLVGSGLDSSRNATQRRLTL